MKRLTLVIFSALMAISAFAIDLNGQYISTFYNRFYRNCTVTLTTSGDSVYLSNLFDFQATVSARYDSISKTLTLPAGQVVGTNSNGSRQYRLYSYTTDASGNYSIDNFTDIVFNLVEYPTYLKLEAQRDLMLVYGNMQVYTNYRYVALRNRQNAILQAEVVDKNSPDSTIGVERYPVYVDYLGEGKYRIDNFGGLGRILLTTNREQSSFTSEYGSYPSMYSSSLHNYYFPCSFVLNGAQYTFDTDLNLRGDVADTRLQFSTAWNHRCDNRNNTDADAQYQKLYYYNADMHINTTITLTDSTMRFMFPHTTHAVTQTELILTSLQNFATYNEEGWMWSGDIKNDANVQGITNKRSTIEPGTDSIISATYVSGLNLKQSTLSKNIYMRISGVNTLKYYVTSNASEARMAEILATTAQGDTISKQTSSTNAGAVDTIHLDPEKTYDVLFRTADGKDMTLYAVQLIVGNGTTTSLIDQPADSQSIQYYSITGIPLSEPQKGLNIIRLSDGTTQKVLYE